MKFSQLSLLVSTIILVTVSASAAITDISDRPLNSNGSDIARPNVMLLLDDSGSMESNFTPDWVASGAYLCTKSAANTAGTTPASRISNNATFCSQDNLPPFRSPDVNAQYYNPEIYYAPPLNFDMTRRISMNAANTVNWTVVPDDAYGVVSTLTYNLVTGYRDVYYCNSGGTNCASDTNYNLPELTGSTLYSPRQTATANYGAPYYYRVPISEYCKEENLVNCVDSAVPTGVYVYPARLRFCKDVDLLDCQALYSSTYKYTYARYLGTPVTGTLKQATATITVSGLVQSTAAKITSLKVDGEELAGSGISLNVATNNDVANAIAAAINSGSTNFSATAAGAVVTVRSKAGGAAWNSRTVSINSTQTVDTPATWRVTIKNANNASLSKNNCLKSQAPSLSTIQLNGNVGVTNTTVNQCNSTTANAAFDLNSMVASRLTPTFKVVTSVTNSGSDRYFDFQYNSSQGALDNVTCTLSLQSTSPTTISGSTCTRTVNGVTGGALFSVNGTTAAKDSSGTTASGTDGAYFNRRVPFQRVDIIPGNTYPKTAGRTDCAGTVCTYAEEMTNFANWFAYYQYRATMAKTASGIAFSKLNDRYRVGLAYLSNSTIVQVAPFTTTGTMTQRKAWYNQLYATTFPGSTPLRAALSRIGRYYAGKLTGVTDPIEYSCQKNYTVLVTDGYWNGGGGYDINGTAFTTSYDTTLGTYVSRDTGVLDARNIADTLADAAQYYYMTDLRTGAGDPKAKNNVPVNSNDPNPAQHMNTYTIGLGIEGAMKYRKDYASAPTGDFSKIVNGSTGCFWEASASDVCNWPTPVANAETTADDLWHAAVNGRGSYSSTKSAAELADSLRDALSDVVTITGSAAASATSSPNITPTDNSIFSTTYQTTLWDGEIISQSIDPATGNVNPTINWKASDTVNMQANQLNVNPYARSLITYDIAAAGVDKAKDFTFTGLNATERNWFAGHCSNNDLVQCAEFDVTGSRRTVADNANTMIEFIRGQNTANAFNDGSVNYGYLDIYRSLRTNRMGDAINSTPLYVDRPIYEFDYTLPGGYELYADFKTRVDSRPGVLYVGANDGIFHAFEGSTGAELFGYVPRTTMPELWRLADRDYAANHRYFVDGSPAVMDVVNPTTKQWNTIVVGSYRKGGSGYFALDVTDPTNPMALWEVCNSATLCPGKTIPNMGLGYGTPVITRMPAGHPQAGKWVAIVTSGYNNEPSTVTQPTAGAGGAGDGKGYLYILDIFTGTVLDTYSTNAGSTATPSGLGKVSTLASNFYKDGTSTVAYAGDLLGNVWRFNLTLAGNNINATKLVANLKNSSSQPQPITTKIEIGSVPNDPDKPILMISTGRYLGTTDLTDTTTQSIYAIKDPFAYAGATINARDASLMVNQTVADVAGVRTISTPKTVDWNTKNGWYIDLPDSGERGVIDPQLNLGTLLVPANVVNGTLANACEVGGYSWLYQLDYTTGSFISTSVNKAVATQVPSSIIVGAVVIRLPNGTMKVITTTANGTKLPYGMNIKGSTGGSKRVSWREIPF